MKKFLALVLALVMTFSLVTISAGAEDFTDADAITYEEAVAVMSAIEVVGGYADGSFNPTAGLTRGAAAKIICNLILGPTTADALNADSAPYSDVAVDNVFAGYIAYCAKEGIISGYADGTFRPAAPLTGYAFMKMLLGALGYDAAVEGYTGANWSINVAKRALNLGLDAGLEGDFVGSKALTREEACLYALNTLTATMVKYNNASTITVGDIVIQNNSEATSVANGANDYDPSDIDAGTTDTTMQFCEQYFAKLKKVAGDADDFGRDAAYKWQLDSEDVYNVLETPVAVYTAETKDTVVAKDLKGYTFNGKKLVDKDTPVGTTTAIGESGTLAGTLAGHVAGLTKYGRIVEIYANDTTKAISDVIVVDFTLGKVTNIVTSAKGDITYTIAGTDDVIYADKDNGTDGVVLNCEVAKNDYVLYTDESGVRYVYPVTTFTGKMTKYNQTTEAMTIDGAVYTAGVASVGATGFTQAQSFTGTTNSTFYVDQYGYIVAVDGVNDIKYAVVDSIAFVEGSGVAASGYVEARLVFNDATTELVKVDLIDGFKIAKTGTAVSSLVTGGTHYTGDKTAVADVTATNATTAVSTNTVATGKYIGVAKSSGGAIEGKFIGVDATAANNDASFKNKVYTYAIDADGNYELTVDTSVSGGSAQLKKGIPAVVDSKVGNNDTIYVVKTKDGTKDVWTAYTGYKAMPTMAAVGVVDAAWTSADGTVFVYVDATATSVGDTTSDVAFFFANEYTVDNTDSTKPLYEYTAILNGELKTVVATADLSVSDNTLYKVTLNDKGQVSAKAAASGADYTLVQANGAPAAVGGVLAVDSVSVNSQTVTALTYDGTETVYFVHTVSETINTGVMEDVADNAQIYVKTVDKTTDAGKIAVATAYVLVAD